MAHVWRTYQGHGLRTGGNWLNLHTTDDCNLRCAYCYLGAKERREPAYDLAALARLVERLGGAVTICFFGGEPTLNIPFMQRVVERLGDRCRYAIQTNGLLLHEVPEDLLRRFVGIGVSIDGAEQVTDRVRGAGVFRRVVDNVARLRSLASVPIMARMTLTEHTDLARDVGVLMEHFEAIYWQLDNDLHRRDFADFERRYCEALPVVIDRFEERAARGQLVNLVPIFGVFWLLLEPLDAQDVYFPCGAGGSALTVDAGGTLFSCPEGVFRGRPEVGGTDVVGHVEDTEGSPLSPRAMKRECRRCEVLPVCGGRCIWTGEPLYCACTRALVRTVQSHAGRLYRHVDRDKLAAMKPTILTTEIIP